MTSVPSPICRVSHTHALAVMYIRPSVILASPVRFGRTMQGASSSTTPEPRLVCGYITQPCKWRRSLWTLTRTHARLRHSVQPCVRQSGQTRHPQLSIPLPGPLQEGLGAWR